MASNATVSGSGASCRSKTDDGLVQKLERRGGFAPLKTSGVSLRQMRRLAACGCSYSNWLCYGLQEAEGPSRSIRSRPRGGRRRSH